MDIQMHRLVKSLCLIDRNISNASLLPPQMLELTKAVVFFKKLQQGRQTASSAHGIYLRRIGYAEWSQPVIVHMEQGDVAWGSMGDSKADVLFLLTDDKSIQLFESFEKVGFTDESYSMKRGATIQNNDESLLQFVQDLSERPELVSTDHSYSYCISHGNFYPCHVENPVIAYRDSSNIKFYEDRRIRLHTLCTSAAVPPTADKKSLISAGQRIIAAYFNVQKRFPEYSGGSEFFLPTPPSPSSSKQFRRSSAGPIAQSVVSDTLPKEAVRARANSFDFS